MARSTRRTFFLSAGIALALPFIISSCAGTGGGFCGGTLAAQIDSLITATGSLTVKTSSIENQVLTACKNIVMDLGGPAPSNAGSIDTQVMTACTAAKNLLTTAVNTNPVTFAITGPRCYVDASAQLSCEVDCQAQASCQPGTVEVRCEPGDLSVVCSGMCSAGATCEATAQAPTVTCQGSCDGVCNGTCSGSTNAAGECSGTCSGTCTGNCTITPGGASVNCGAMARCRGGCTTTGTAPQCEGELTPPTCTVDAQCQTGCEAQASFEATCEPATITVSGGNTALNNTLKTNLPILLEVRDNLASLQADASALATSAQAVATAASADAACAISRAGQLVTAAQGAVNAAASLQVTVSVSVMVTGSATVGP